jgi:hypothetical protein
MGSGRGGGAVEPESRLNLHPGDTEHHPGHHVVAGIAAGCGSGWAHAHARPETNAIITKSFARQLESYRSAARRWTTRAKAETAVQAIAAAVVGYVVQSAFSDSEIDVARYCSGLTVLAG